MKILCDTNIWIEFYKGNHAISDELQRIQVENLAVSIVSIGELYFGARNRIELQKIKQHLTSVHQIVFDKQTTQIFLTLLERYALSHRLSLPDAMIAASALQHTIPLYTLNLRDFRFIEGLSLHQSE